EARCKPLDRPRRSPQSTNRGGGTPMTKENKAGLLAAGAFLALVGAVVALKMRERDKPAGPDSGDQVAQQTRNKAPAKDDKDNAPAPKAKDDKDNAPPSKNQSKLKEVDSALSMQSGGTPSGASIQDKDKLVSSPADSPPPGFNRPPTI